MAKVYYTGTSVRLTCDFYNFEGLLTNPDTVKITIYDYKYEIIDSISMGSSNNAGVGKYYYDYLTDLKESRYIYEWYGEIDGKPSLKRGSFQTRFI